jgi:hypothetical protein
MSTLAPERPVPRCCGYCQSRDVKQHCDGKTVYCSMVTCTKCGAVSSYTRAMPKDRQADGRTWRLIYTKGANRLPGGA